MVNFMYIWRHAQSCLSLCDLKDYSPFRLLCSWDCPGKNTGVGCYFSSTHLPNLGIKPTSPVAPKLQADSLPLSHQGSPMYTLPQFKKKGGEGEMKSRYTYKVIVY